MDLPVENAEKDVEARAALWKAICVASDDVRYRFRVSSICGIDGVEVRSDAVVPEVATSRLVEALSLLCVIIRSEEATADVINVLGKTGPVEIHEDNAVRYLWAQQTLRGEHSGLSGRPDLIVASIREQPHSANATRIIEAKCVRQLGTQVVRSEFGKAHDLRVGTYFIWSFYSPSSRVIAGARGLGIDLEALGFDTARRRDLLTDPQVLISRVAYAQEQARKAQRFVGALEKAGREARQKLLRPVQ